MFQHQAIPNFMMNLMEPCLGSVSEVLLAEEKETNFEDLDASTDAGSELPEPLG